MNSKIVVLLIFALGFNACSGKQNKKPTELAQAKRTFQMANIPSMITDPDQRAAYLAQHYWDNFNFADTIYVHEADVTEQAMSNYIDVLKRVQPDMASSSIKAMLAKAEVDSTMFAYMAGLYDKYLYDPNSPMRDESLYISVLQVITASAKVSEVDKIRPQHLLDLALKNQVGRPATDFIYTLPDGSTGRLHSIKADMLLLFFYNPDCHNCQQITRQLDDSEVVNRLMQSKQLKILAVYPDEDIEAWRKHVSLMPVSWINSYDKSLDLKNKEVYDLKAIPTLYLLDKEKKVVLKDATFAQVEAYLTSKAK